MTTHSPDLPQHDTDRHARTAALAALGSSPGAGGPSISYASAGRALLIGPEHRIRRLAAALERELPLCGLVTEAMPEHISEEMEAAAEMAQDMTLLQAPLKVLDGYLGHFDVQLEIDGQTASLAKLVFKHDYCDLVVDLNAEPRIQRELLPPGYLHAGVEADLDEVAEQARALLGTFEKPRYVRIDAGRCAHSANGKTGCTRCLDACPADAIHSLAGRIQIDSHLCHGAGGCAAACPTGAIRYDHPEPALVQARLERLLATYLANGGASPAVLLHDADAGARWIARSLDALDGRWLPLQVEETGSAGLDLWLQALARGASEVVLLATDMTDTVRRDLERELAVARPLLAALGGGHRIELLTDPDTLALRPAPSARAIPPLPGRVVDYDKRALISAATAHLYRNSGLPVADAAIALPVGAAFGTLQIRVEGCTLCNACVSACPVKALGSGRDRPLLSFVEDKCVQCGLCAQSCPEKVLTLEPRYQLDPEIRASARTLKEEAPFECIRCGKPFATQSMIRSMQARLAGHYMFAGPAAERLKMCGDCRVVDMAASEQDAGLVGLGEAVTLRRTERNPH